jgi:hypothetical protein
MSQRLALITAAISLAATNAVVLRGQRARYICQRRPIISGLLLFSAIKSSTNTDKGKEKQWTARPIPPNAAPEPRS